MNRIISFHPVSTEFFDETIGPLTGGGKINPENFVNAAIRLRRAEWDVKGWRFRLEQLLEALQPPPPPTEGGVWTKLRARLERFDFKPDATAAKIAGKVDPDLHLWGRPFLIFENSPDRVSMTIDDYGDAADTQAVESLVLEQLIRIDPELPAKLEPAETGEPSANMTYRNDLLDAMKAIHAVARRSDPTDSPEPLTVASVPTRGKTLEEMPWHAVWLHSRANPFWVGREIDGLDSVCAAAGIQPPDCLVPAWPLFATAAEQFPDFRETLGMDLQRDQDVGGFVAPADVPELIAFLNQSGSKIIQAATREGVGTLCATMLRKVRECAHHAQRLGRGYLEASGIMPVWFDPDDYQDSDGEA